jgi:hypothetical protein
VRRDDGRVIATFRVAEQTSRWGRFAMVTVRVVTAAEDAVVLAADVGRTEADRREATGGAADALRRTPRMASRHRVTVTEIVATEVDTGVGDVYEATVQAVWRALDLTVTYTGVSDPQIVQSWLRSRIGQRLAGVTEARHWYHNKRKPGAASLLHVWLHFDGRPPTQLHGHGDELMLSTAEPFAACDMEEYGEIRVGPASAPDLLAGMVDRRLTNAAVILSRGERRPMCSGLLLRFDSEDVVIGTLCDEWILARSPAAHLDAYWQRQDWIMQT